MGIDEAFNVQVIRSILTHYHDWVDVSDPVKGALYEDSFIESAVLRACSAKEDSFRLDYETKTTTYEFEGTLVTCLDKLHSLKGK